MKKTHTLLLMNSDALKPPCRLPLAEDGHPPKLVRAMPANERGRDFVVGDLHGCFDLLDRLLEHVRFDPASDRLFSVGDLIDRGPDSPRCAEFLQVSWFHAVKGNHETMLLEFFGPYFAEGTMDYWDRAPHSDVWLNGGDWIEACYLPDEQRMTDAFDGLLAKLRDLPLIWVVGKGGERFHVLHAELIRPGYRRERCKVWLDADIDRWLAGEPVDRVTREELVWGRTLLNALAGPSLPPAQTGLSTTYCGHTIGEGVRTYLSHVCLDTGAYLPAPGFGLTLHSVHEERTLRAMHGRAEIVDVSRPSAGDGKQLSLIA